MNAKKKRETKTIRGSLTIFQEFSEIFRKK